MSTKGSDSPGFWPVNVARAHRWPNVFVVGIVAIFLGASGLVAGQEQGPRLAAIRYEKQILPILAENCFACHGRDAESREAELRLDTPEGAFADREGTRAIVPGNLDESEAWLRIISDDDEVRMPPPASKKELSQAQKDILRAWIEQGAPFERHWSFATPVATTPPAVPGASDDEIRNPIDAFIRARLRSEGISWSSEADRPTLIRRVAFVVTGLPPTPAEVAAFLADDRPGAYERMLDRYLESPHYGEEMARHWLDVARYADTHGMHLDNERHMWAYRDWVVEAFNRNQPFDQFTIDQLAGDLLEHPSQEQLIATGYNRCNVTSSEGGSIDAELLFRYAVDRAATAIQTWTGLTAGCAVCHDHKFDPLSQKEFYSLYAFFNSASDPAMDGNSATTPPILKLETPKDRETLASIAAELDRQQQQLDALAANTAYQDPAGPDSAGPDRAGQPSAVEGEDKPAALDPGRSLLAWWRQATGKELPNLPGEINRIAKQGPEAEVSDADRALLRNYYLQNVCEETKQRFAPLLDSLGKLRATQKQIDEAIPTTFVYREMAQPRESFVMLRGAYDKPGDRVQPNVPAVFPPLSRQAESGPATRLDLARWLVSPDHPLTSRVTVNRFWQQLFGTGLVKTSYDFGSQGELPSHPELLDWLAVQFQQQGWNVKQLMRLMLSSATFRQSSAISDEVRARDPENRLLAHGPRLRLDAEQIRDNALYVSGLMDLTMGGKGVRTYQPENIWEPVGFAGSNTRFYKRDSGAALYRRSLYTFLKRTAPPPFMSNFDAPNREQFCARRDRSNTPLQALQLMNDVQYVEAARALAERVIREGGTTADERIDYAFRLVLARPPEAAESQVMLTQLRAHRTRYAAEEDAARKIISQGETKPAADGPSASELAAYTLVANMVLNLDESLTRN